VIRSTATPYGALLRSVVKCSSPLVLCVFFGGVVASVIGIDGLRYRLRRLIESGVAGVHGNEHASELSAAGERNPSSDGVQLVRSECPGPGHPCHQGGHGPVMSDGHAPWPSGTSPLAVA